MNNRNLIVALIALWCYTRNCNINLANNTAILLILYALLSRGNNVFGNQLFNTCNQTPHLFRNPTPFPFGAQSFQTTPCCAVY